MRRHIATLLALGAAAGVVCSSPLADPQPPGNGHNCAGFTSTFAGPGFGGEVSGVARAFPSAIPATLDFADCGGNGFPP
jgi:hypothetical protein